LRTLADWSRPVAASPLAACADAECPAAVRWRMVLGWAAL
jgi:hypothetical protein